MPRVPWQEGKSSPKGHPPPRGFSREPQTEPQWPLHLSPVHPCPEGLAEPTNTKAEAPAPLLALLRGFHSMAVLILYLHGALHVLLTSSPPACPQTLPDSTCVTCLWTCPIVSFSLGWAGNNPRQGLLCCLQPGCAGPGELLLPAQSIPCTSLPTMAIPGLPPCHH